MLYIHQVKVFELFAYVVKMNGAWNGVGLSELERMGNFNINIYIYYTLVIQ